MDSNHFEFETEIQKAPDMDAAYIIFPYNVSKVFGTRGMVKVKAWFEGYLYRGVLMTMGTPFHCIGITKEIRKAIGKQPGDRIHVVIEKDYEPRIIEVPDDVKEALLKEPGLSEFFPTLSFTYQKEYIRYVTEAKKQETRKKRIQKVLQTVMELMEKKNSDKN